jgi:hypothetical protein
MSHVRQDLEAAGNTPADQELREPAVLVGPYSVVVVHADEQVGAERTSVVSLLFDERHPCLRVISARPGHPEPDCRCHSAEREP